MELFPGFHPGYETSGHSFGLVPVYAEPTAGCSAGLVDDTHAFVSFCRDYDWGRWALSGAWFPFQGGGSHDALSKGDATTEKAALNIAIEKQVDREKICGYGSE